MKGVKGYLALVLFLVFPVLVQPAAGIQADSLYMALQPDSVRQVDVVIPDDSGSILAGKAEYTVRLEPFSQNESWADFSEQVVRTDENNTVIIPIHFSTFGRKMGECSEGFRLSISSYTGPERVIQGRVCVSQFEDVDTGGEAGDIGGVELFDMKLNKRVVYGAVGEKVNITLMMMSLAELTVDLNVEGDIGGSLEKESVSFDSRHLYQTVGIQFEPGEGSFGFEVVAKIRDCEGAYCQRSVKGKLIVGEEPAEEAGFTVSLFPGNINLKEPGDVDFRLTVVNNQESGNFDADLELDEGLETDFKKRSVFVGKGSERTLEFRVTPGAASRLYSITAVVVRGEVVKRATSYISTGEMLTDALRGAERAEDREEAEQEVDSWYQRYKDGEYGEGLDDYSKLKERLSELEGGGAGGGGADNGDTGKDGDGGNGYDVSFIIIVVVLVVLAAAGVGIYFFKIRGREELEGV